jgi:hypothetical protein
MYYIRKLSEQTVNLIIHLVKRPGSRRSQSLDSRGEGGQEVTYVLENFVPCLTTFSTASRKSRSVATLRRARIANMPAWTMVSDNAKLSDITLHTSVATDRNSAPVVFGHKRAMRSNRISLSTLILRAWIRRMCALPSLSGNENSIRRSSRPGRNRAGSRVSGLHRCQSRRKASTGMSSPVSGH